MPEPTRDPVQDAKDMQQRYKNVFGTVEGKRVLGDILSVAGFGGETGPDPNDPAKVAWYNCAIEIARLAGALPDHTFQQLGMTKRK